MFQKFPREDCQDDLVHVSDLAIAGNEAGILLTACLRAFKPPDGTDKNVTPLDNLWFTFTC